MASTSNAQAQRMEDIHSCQTHTEQPGYNHPPQTHQETVNVQPEYYTQMYPHINAQQTGSTVVLVQSQEVDPATINSYWYLSITSIICCICFIPSVISAIAAIVLSCLTDSSKKEGNYIQARTYSQWAKYLGVTTIVLGVIGCVIAAITIVSALASQ